MDESRARISQANSDRRAAERERKAAAGSQDWRHAIAKYQQAVEKCIKAIVAALRESGFRAVNLIGYDHSVQHHVRMLRRLPNAAAGRSVQAKLKEFLDSSTRKAIQSLEALAPRAPTAGRPHMPNTEYPFNDARGRWSYPEAPDVFSAEEVDRFQDLTRRVAYYANGIISSLRRGPA